MIDRLRQILGKRVVSNRRAGQAFEYSSYVAGLGISFFGLTGVARVVTSAEAAFLGVLAVMALSMLAVALGALVHLSLQKEA